MRPDNQARNIREKIVNKSKGNPTPVYTKFEEKCSKELVKQDLVDLAAGTLSAIRVRGFFSKELCAEVMENLQTVELGEYDQQVVSPRIAKLGPSAFDYYIDGGIGDEYWEHRDQSDEVRSALAKGIDPLVLAMEKISLCWGSDVRKSSINGRRLFAGMIREINEGARIHFDEIERELPNGLDDTPVAQLAFNCHLEMPKKGGEATIFRRRWMPQDEDNRDGYGYPYDLVKDQPYTSVRAEVGDAVIFDPRNYHRVETNKSPGRRVTLSFFMGLTADGILEIWS
ncbi:hypothetical protein D9543_10975 [Corynebacterium macginleyi]|uniref:Prolyl 4-hydroxylase alpha subunit Fe(2+) 2OG dioxygenase domain-containing protein n=2 Tax=Corynebacterium macginleyi TaxID=38290 RepID=A0A3M0FVA5_9CORY|nr:hypothetical protein D9543_10975 [Corynebacterium macginleyi]RMB65182.1 hypothetical protein D9542_10685 [Corynebacterium macginleyi]